MSHLSDRANRLGADLVAPLAATTEVRILVREGDVVTATPAAAAAVGVTAAGAAAVAGYAAEEAADS